MSKHSPVSLVQILKNDQENIDILEANAKFLEVIGVEYIIVDISKNAGILGKLNKIEAFRKKRISYIRLEKSSLKQAFIQGIDIASFDQVYFLSEEEKVDEVSLVKIDRESPKLKKIERKIFVENFPLNFDFKNFYLFMKKEKSIFDKIKIYFS